MEGEKQCCVCKGFVTVNHYTQKYPMWYKNPDNTSEYLCRKCYLKTVSNKKHNPRLIRFLSKRILMPFDFRRYFCIRCNAYVDQTDVHHIEYIIIMPVCAFTVELCDYHHRLENIRKEELGKDYYFDFTPVQVIPS